MNRLKDIAVRVELPAPRTGGLGGGVAAVLNELIALLDAATPGGAAAIDLRSLPMSPADREELQAVLGTGEVTATIDADGLSTLQETSIGGVWWVAHRNREGELIAELLEVARIPPILVTAPEDMSRGAKDLKSRVESSVAWARKEGDNETRQ